MRNKIKADLIIKGGQVVAGAGQAPPIRGGDMQKLAVSEQSWIVCTAEKIAAVGEKEEIREKIKITGRTRIIDAQGMVITPGLIDAHTHLVFGGTREDEFYLRAQGADYMEIMAAGGGIASSVRATRQATLEDLVASGRQRLRWMLEMGVTTVECKSGYGLDLATELKQLEAVKILQKEQPVELVPTFMGAHAWPAEYKGNQEGYLDFLINTVMPEVKERNLAEYVDVFCETGVFSVEQSRRILTAAQKMGFGARIHAEEMSTLGGAELAAELETASADHLLMISKRGIERLKESSVMPILLPATAFTLRRDYAPARKMLDAGLPLALATDFNPGSCPAANLALTMSIACLYMGLTPEETFNAVTLNAAYSLGRGARLGSLEVGKQADLVIFEVDQYQKIPYFIGVNLAKFVIKKGSVVVG